MGQKQDSLIYQKINLKLFYNENLYYLLYSSTNPIFGKIFIPEI